MKKRTTKDAFAQRLVRVGHVRAASRREGIGVLEGFCVSPKINETWVNKFSLCIKHSSAYYILRFRWLD